MSLSPTFAPSSPDHPGTARRSRFTYRQLAQLTSYSTTNPLRVVAHIDLDAFFACHTRIVSTRLTCLRQGLIAINYPARALGIGRHCTVTDAKKLCPNLIAQHVATWREGDSSWAYRDDAAANISTDKVSLDPYRLESRKILAIVKEVLPQNLQKVEKASIDEVFLDLSAHVHSILLDRFVELHCPPPYDDPTETLPLPSIAALDWQADALVDLDEEQEALDPDWDDVAILIGSEIVRNVRSKVREKLGYTCSAGIASNKMVSKLASAFKKPNQQTVVRTRAMQSFLSGFKITRIRNFGGKLGDQVVSALNTESVQEILNVPLEQMQAKLGDDTGRWVYGIVRGADSSEVNSRTQIKSMLSAKSFRPTIGSPEQATKWLRIFAADIYARLVEEGVLEHKRRPRSINLHHRQATQMRSRQGPIPSGKTITENGLFELAKDLLGQIMTEDKVWPCSNLSLSVGGFEDGVKDNMGIGAFLVKGEEAAYLHQSKAGGHKSLDHDTESQPPPTKKPRIKNGGIQKFFSPTLLGEEDLSDKANLAKIEESSAESRLHPYGKDTSCQLPEQKQLHAAEQLSVSQFVCSRCKATLPNLDDLQNHTDWHVAKDLYDEERVKPAFVDVPSTSRTTIQKKPPASSKRARGGKLEQGQRKLNFG